MGYYPIAIDVTGRPCLVVGGGEIALRKAKGLLESGARVRVIAPEIDDRLSRLEGIVIERRAYQAGDVAGHVLVFAATDDREINSAISREAGECGALVNVVDDPELCSFIAPALVRRGDLMIAVTTSGRSPVLAKRIRKDIEERYGPEYGVLVEILGGLRDSVKAEHGSQSEREVVFNRLLDSGILELIREGKITQAREKALKCIW